MTTSKLQAVNTIISNIGQAPATSLESQNPMVQLAQNILDDVARGVQQEGWSFNTEADYPFPPDNNGEIKIPSNVLSLDTSRYTQEVPVMREGKLYDKRNHTYKWSAPIKADVVWVWDFEYLPEAFKNYIAIRASNLFAMRAVGNTEVAKYSEQEEKMARATAMEYETQQGDYNMLNSEDGRPVRRGYRPVNTIARF